MDVASRGDISPSTSLSTASRALYRMIARPMRTRKRALSMEAADWRTFRTSAQTADRVCGVD
jgi:hypothetical protein